MRRLAGSPGAGRSRRTRRHPWTRFVAIGDSITEGYGMDAVPGVEQLPWAVRVARALDVELHNLGRRNLRAAQVRETQLARALALEPDLVSIAAGPNDLLAEDFDCAQIERDLEPLYAAFAGTNATVFTFGFMNLPDSGLLPPAGADWLRPRMEALHDAIRLLAERHGALYLDFYSDPATADPSFYSADLQHANAAGQRYVAERTVEALLAHARKAERAPEAPGAAARAG